MKFIATVLLFILSVTTTVSAQITTSVRLLLLDHPNTQQVVNDGKLLKSNISFSSTNINDHFFVEVWTSSTEPERYGNQGLTTAVVDIVFPNSFFKAINTTLSPQWSMLKFDNKINQADGIIDNVGGNNLAGLAIYPNWHKISVIEFTVLKTINEPVKICSQFAGGHYTYAVKGYGILPKNRIDFGCVTAFCATDSECNDGNSCTTDLCVNNSCEYGEFSCTSPEPCAVSQCNEISGCEVSPKDCNDGLFCNGDDLCINGECQHSGNPCESGLCDEVNDVCRISEDNIIQVTIIYTCILGVDGNPTSCWLDSTKNSSTDLSSVLVR